MIGPITGAVTGRPIGNNEFIQQFGAWEVRKDIESFTNDISLSRQWPNASVTAGFAMPPRALRWFCCPVVTPKVDGQR